MLDQGLSVATTPTSLGGSKTLIAISGVGALVTVAPPTVAQQGSCIVQCHGLLVAMGYCH